jgi:hypothetical protein
MKSRSTKLVTTTVIALLAAAPAVEANRLGQAAAARGGGGGGQRPANIQRPAQRPANVQRPAQRPANIQRPAQRPANVQRPAQRPANIQRPANAGGGRLPGANRPAGVQRPPLPAHAGPSGSIHRPQQPQQAARPDIAAKLPGAGAKLPGAAQNLGGSAQKLQGALGKDRPNQPIDFGSLGQNRPKLPGNDKMAGVANRLPGNLTKPSDRPAIPKIDASKRPDFSQINRRPAATQPGQGQLAQKLEGRRPASVPPQNQLQKYPGLADKLEQRPGGYQKWQANRESRWDSWHGQREDRLNQFQTNRNDRWNNISALQDNRQDFYTNRREDWQSWANNVQDYRQDRAWEILDNVRDYNSNLFVPDWYYNNPWYGGYYYNQNVNPWVWWRPAVWSGLAAFLGNVVGNQMSRDYGTQVYYDKETVYVEGQPVAPAPQYREEALQLASVPPPEEPFAPAEKGDESGWYPLGVWALTQEEKGDAVMFYQLAVNKDGEVSGAYSNVLTGETSPVTGSVDFDTQRVAWRTGDSDSTAIEANLPGLTKEFTPVFVHYGTGQTQEWLMVRMEDPS